jgi:AcrR family transcriptional regulator
MPHATSQSTTWMDGMAKAGQRPLTLAMKRSAAQQKDRAQYGAKRVQILKAAGPVLQRYGLSGTTIGAIADVAGVDRATIYYYFSDKSAIFREAIYDGLVEMIGALEAVAASGKSPALRLRDSMRVVMSAYEKHYPQLYIFFTDGAPSSVIDTDLNAEIVDSGRRYEELVEAIVRDGTRRGEFHTPLPPKVFAKAVTGMLNWTSRWYAPGGALAAEDVADGMADMILRGVLVADQH